MGYSSEFKSEVIEGVQQIGFIDNSKAADLMVKFSEELSNLSQDKKIDYTNQFILNLMDYTEQSDDEHVWCELYKKFQEIIKNYE